MGAVTTVLMFHQRIPEPLSTHCEIERWPSVAGASGPFSNTGPAEACFLQVEAKALFRI